MNIILADPHLEVQSALTLVLNQMEGVNVVGITGDIDQLIVFCQHDCPDLILFDLGLIKTTRNNFINRHSLKSTLLSLRENCPDVKIVLMSNCFQNMEDLLTYKVDGYISKTDLPQIVRDNISKFLKEDQK